MKHPSDCHVIDGQALKEQLMKTSSEKWDFFLNRFSTISISAPHHWWKIIGITERTDDVAELLCQPKQNCDSYSVFSDERFLVTLHYWVSLRNVLNYYFLTSELDYFLTTRLFCFLPKSMIFVNIYVLTL